MSILRNLLGNFMPHPERREASGSLAAINSEVVLALNGDESAVVFFNTGGASATLTYTVDVSPNGTDFFPALCFPYTPACLGGALQAGQPLQTEGLTGVITRTLCVAVGQMRALRIRVTAYTSGLLNVLLTAGVDGSISSYVREQRAATLCVTATAATGIASTATLPAVVGLRHYIDRIDITATATATAAGTATPVLVTTTNIPGNPILTLGNRS